MKKSLVALATMTVVASAFADVDVSGGVKIYGVLDQGYQSQSLTNPTANTSNDYQGMYASNGTSRFGVKASRDLGDGLKGVAQAELELAPDTATLLPSANRQSFVGLVSEKAGTLLMGTMETTAYEVWAMDVNGRVEYKPQVWRTLASVSMQDRANNAIKYISPEFGGFTLHLMQSFAEKASTVAVAAPTLGSANSFSEFTSVGLKYKGENLTAAFLHDQTTYIQQGYKFAGVTNAGVSATTVPASYNSVMLYGASGTSTTGYLEATQRDIIAFNYNIDGTILSYIYGKSYQSGGGSNTTSTIGFRKAFDKVTVAYSYGTGVIDSKATASSIVYTLAGDGTITDSTLGAYYNFDKSTQAYMLYSHSTSSVGYYDGVNNTFAIGARYNF